MAELIIRNLEEALEALDLVNSLSPGDTAPTIEIAGELSKLRIKFSGENFKSSLTGGAVRGLWEYQQSIYRGMAALLYGVDDIRKLTSEQQRAFELNFFVREGSTDTLADLVKLANGLKEGFNSMDSRHKALVLITFALTLGVAVPATMILESQEATKRQKLINSLEETRNDASVRQLELFASVVKQNSDLSRFVELNNIGTQQLVKNAQGTESIDIGKVHFDQNEIEEIRQRSPRGVAQAEVVTGHFKIIQLTRLTNSLQKLLVSNNEVEEVKAVLDEENFSEEQLKQIYEAYKENKLIDLTISMTVVKDAVRSANIVDIPGDNL